MARPGLIEQRSELFECLTSDEKPQPAVFMGEINFHKFTLDTN